MNTTSSGDIVGDWIRLRRRRVRGIERLYSLLAASSCAPLPPSRLCTLFCGGKAPRHSRVNATTMSPPKMKSENKERGQKGTADVAVADPKRDRGINQRNCRNSKSFRQRAYRWLKRFEASHVIRKLQRLQQRHVHFFFRFMEMRFRRASAAQNGPRCQVGRAAHTLRIDAVKKSSIKSWNTSWED